MGVASTFDGGTVGGEQRRWWTLGAVSLGLFMIMLDNTVVNVALPSIERDLGMSLSQLEWVVTGYALSFAAFMLTGGKLADLLGRRLVFVAGLAVFTAASLALRSRGWRRHADRCPRRPGHRCSHDEPGDALDHHRDLPAAAAGTAIGIWAGVSALALAIGPLVGGLLSEHVDWSWIFFVNVPVGVIAIVAAFLFVDESRDTSRDQRPDVPGLVTSAVGLFALTYALIEANNHGWGSTRILGAFALAAVSLVAFVVLELRQRRPMLDLTLFRDSTFSGANVSMLLVALAMFGVFFYVSLYVQQILGYSPVEAGASFLPATILIAVLAPQVGRVVDRVGSRWLTGAGMVSLSLSLLLYSRLGTGSSYWDILPGLVLMGVGMALVMTPTTAAAMSSVPRDQAGVGSAVLNSMRQVGGSLGIAVTGAIVAHVTSTSLAAGDSRPEAFVHGFQRGLEIAALIALAGAVVAVATMRTHRQRELHAEEPALQEAA